MSKQANSKTNNKLIQMILGQWFLIGLITVMFLSWLLPAPDAQSSIPQAFKLGLIASIFLISGFSLRTSELIHGFRHWKLHVFIQVFSLGLTALMCWGLDLLWQQLGISQSLRIGLLVLGALPTTITSCVALTMAAGGNQGGAIVNATFGNLAGVLITPLWLMLMLHSDGESLNLYAVLQKLGMVVLLPLLIGQILQWPLASRLPPKLKKIISKLTLLCLLGVVYISFNIAFHQGISASWTDIGLVALICLLLHFVWLAIPWFGSSAKAFQFNREDRICILICGSQKTLALGIPLIALCFPGHPELPLITLPILIYHPIQLLLAAPIVQYFQNQNSPAIERQVSS